MKRSAVIWVVAIAAVVVVAVVLVVFQPQKLLIDKRVDEAVPAAAEPAAVEPAAAPASPAASAAAPRSSQPAPAAASSALSSAPAAPASPPAATPNRRGEFRSLNHHGSGGATLLKTGTAFVVRFEDLDVENGPDLHVYLSTAPSESKAAAFNDDFVDLGRLKGNKGNQNYEVPAAVDVTRFKSVVVWCKRFSSGFAVAPLA